MDIRFLESFVTVVESGSIAEAARRLNLTPAAVSQRLMRLEEEIGHKLVRRAGRTVRPTGSGLAVLLYATDLIENANNLKAIAANNLPAGQLRLGATATSLTGLLPQIMARMRDQFPQIEYFVRPGSSNDLYQSVIAGEIDAALLVKPQFPVPKSAGWLTLRQEPLVLIAPIDVPLDNIHTVLEKHRFLRYDRNQWGGQIVDRYLRQHHLRVQEWLELDALDAIATLVDRGLGISIVPDWPPPWPEGLNIRKLELPDGGVREIGLIWRLFGPRIAAVRAFVKTCDALAAESRRSA